MPINYLAEWYTSIDDESESGFAYLEEDIHDDIRAERNLEE